MYSKYVHNKLFILVIPLPTIITNSDITNCDPIIISQPLPMTHTVLLAWIVWNLSYFSLNPLASSISNNEFKAIQTILLNFITSVQEQLCNYPIYAMSFYFPPFQMLMYSCVSNNERSWLAGIEPQTLCQYTSGLSYMYIDSPV